MSWFEILRVALLDLALHKFRSLLAVLGIIFGVASVEGMISISEGAKRAAMEKYAALGIDNILLRSVKPTKAAPPKDSSGSGERRYVAEYGLLRRDLDHVRALFPGVRATAGLKSTRQTLYSPTGKEVDLPVLATEPVFLDITRSRMLSGRFLTWLDQRDRKRTCVVGAEAARKLFTFHDPMQQPLRVGNDWYEVVGVLENRSGLKDQGYEDFNSSVFIPLETAQAMYGDLAWVVKTGSQEVTKVELDGIYVQMNDPVDVLGTADRLSTYLHKTHKASDYVVTVPLAEMRQKEAEQRIWSIVMGAIAAISLVVGGICIMIIMLANISDRRKEIGTRRALGARRKDILTQFVLESATLTSIGGLLGAALGYAISASISMLVHWPTAFTSWSVVLGVVMSTAVGILFGFWPAYTAAKVNPIEALRSE